MLATSSQLFIADLTGATVKPPPGIKVHTKMGASLGYKIPSAFASSAEHHGNQDTARGLEARAVVPAGLAGISMPGLDPATHHVMVTRARGSMDEQMARAARMNPLRGLRLEVSDSPPQPDAVSVP